MLRFVFDNITIDTKDIKNKIEASFGGEAHISVYGNDKIIITHIDNADLIHRGKVLIRKPNNDDESICILYGYRFQKIDIIPRTKIDVTNGIVEAFFKR